MDGSDGRRRRLVKALPWIVVGVVMVSLAGVAVGRLFLDDGPDAPDQATSVQDVAALTVDITEGLDVAAGVALLCGDPFPLYRMAVESTIIRWQNDTGTQAPTLEAEVSDVATGASGSFVLGLRSGDQELQGVDRDWRVFVEVRDGRSCVTGVGGVDAEAPTTVFSRTGYTGVTSPPPAPRS